MVMQRQIEGKWFDFTKKFIFKILLKKIETIIYENKWLQNSLIKRILHLNVV